MENLKEAVKSAILTIVKEAEGEARDGRYTDGEGSRPKELSQAALNLSATLAQLGNIEVQEEHLRLDKLAEEGVANGEPRPTKPGVVH